MTRQNQDSRLQQAIIYALSFLCAPVWTEQACGGNGTYKNGKFNFCVCVRFNASPTQIDQIKTAFQNASQVLVDATDGQQQFGTITIVNNSGASQVAEYWVNPGGGRAYATFGQYGVRGEHVMLFFDSNFAQTDGSDGDAYTIAHEHAHHAYGVADEYKGPPNDMPAECAALESSTLSFCLMDNYFIRGGRSGGGSTYTLNEFCVAANHDPDSDTDQDAINQKSCYLAMLVLDSQVQQELVSDR